MFSFNFRPGLLGFCLLFLSHLSFGQTALWQDIQESNITAKPSDRLVIPDKYRTLHLDFEQLKSVLANAPQEQSIFDGGAGMPLAFPFPDGRMVRFRVWETAMMAPELMAQFPNNHTYAGTGMDNGALYIRFDISSDGFHAMVLGVPESPVFIDPYAKGNTADYTCHFKKDFRDRSLEAFVCHVIDTDSLTAPAPVVESRAGTCSNGLRTYRLAVACTGEYSFFHGSNTTNNDKTAALNAVITSVNRVSGVFELDASIRLQLIANETSVIYLWNGVGTSCTTDPYSNTDGVAMLSENVTNCNAVIGTANYDMGHVFSTNGGGVASTGPCSTSNKARGVTGTGSPIGDNFDIDYVAHEMGHQFSAAHTFHSIVGSCGGNQSNNSAMEPGSGSTIMAYAGICGGDDLQPHSDAYYHARSLQQLASGGGTCAALSATGNTAPVVTVPATSYTIPISTPFVLDGSATDVNGSDVLTYCWEEVDAFSMSQSPMPPQPTSATGPLFRSFSPTSATKRYFPQLSYVWSNTNSTWEVLPSVSRAMSFRLTVRDNHAGGGCTSEANVTVNSNVIAGPFQVTVPNGGQSYPGNSVQTVTWNVANSTASPVSCANVDILFTLDGGASFTTLLSSTPNDGSADIVYPNLTTTTARVMVKGTGNVFYDVSNADFTLTAPIFPVELIDFTARKVGNAVQLDWSTASEKTNRGFQIERSVGNAFDFQPIGWKDGHGTTSEKQSYSFNDAAIKAGTVYYYRLQQTDVSGRQIASDVKVVVTEGGAGVLSIVPNPAVTSVKIILPISVGDELFRASVWNTDGQLMLEQTLQNTETLDVANLPDGVYFLRVWMDNALYQGRFVKQ